MWKKFAEEGLEARILNKMTFKTYKILYVFLFAVLFAINT